jgi:hypothetical protein
MKKFIYVLILAVCFLCSCEPKETHKFTTIDRYDGEVPVYYVDEYLYDGQSDRPPINIVVIDSCEYLHVCLYDGTWQFTHKGNCKYCEERREKTKDKDDDFNF